MSTSAEVVQAILTIVVIGLAIRNGKLKREKELLFKQLCRMRDKEEGENENYLLCKRSKRLLKYQKSRQITGGLTWSRSRAHRVQTAALLSSKCAPTGGRGNMPILIVPSVESSSAASMQPNTNLIEMREANRTLYTSGLMDARLPALAVQRSITLTR